MENEDIFFSIIGIMFIVVILITVFFSCITMTTIIYNWNSRCRSISNLLACNSCVAFLFFNITISIQIPYIFQINNNERNNVFTTFCKIRAFLLLFACIAKVFSYLIQAISRYFITILYKHKNLLTFHTNGIMILFSWIVSIIISSGMFISPVSFQYEYESRLCILTSKVFYTSFTLMVIVFIIPVIIIVFLYALILWHTTHANRIYPNNVTPRNNKRNIKVFRNILILLTIVIVGGTPFLLSVIINSISKSPWPLYLISVLFITLSAAVESVTLFITNKEVKTIIFAKTAFHQVEKIHTLTIVPTTKVLTKCIETNKIQTIQAIT